MRRPPADSSAAGLPELRAGIEELRAFVAVARAGSVIRAAAALHRTQPTLSARIAALELAWETKLFRRTARGMALTPEGAGLLPRVEAILEDLRGLEKAAGLPLSPVGELRLGAGDALGRELLPRALAGLLREEPRLEVRLREGSGAALLEALGRGEIDLALVVEPSAGAGAPGLALKPLLESPVVMLAPPGRRPRRGALPLKALAGERLVGLQPGSGFRRHLEAAFAAAGLAFRPAVEVGNLSLVRRFVAAGLGVAPVPAIAFPEGRGLAGVRAHPLQGMPPVRYMQAVRAGAALPGPALRLLERLES